MDLFIKTTQRGRAFITLRNNKYKPFLFGKDEIQISSVEDDCVEEEKQSIEDLLEENNINCEEIISEDWS